MSNLNWGTVLLTNSYMTTLNPSYFIIHKDEIFYMGSSREKKTAMESLFTKKSLHYETEASVKFPVCQRRCRQYKHCIE